MALQKLQLDFGESPDFYQTTSDTEDRDTVYVTSVTQMILLMVLMSVARQKGAKHVCVRNTMVFHGTLLLYELWNLAKINISLEFYIFNWKRYEFKQSFQKIFLANNLFTVVLWHL